MSDMTAEQAPARRVRGRPGARVFASAGDHVTKGAKWALILMIVLTLIPIQPDIAGVKMIPSRMFLLAMVIPYTMRLFKMPNHAFNLSDGLILFLAFWIFVTFLFHHGAGRFQYALMSSVEVFGAYVAGRVLISNYASLRYFLKYYFLGLLILLPFAIWDNRTGQNIILEFFNSITFANPRNVELRSGGYRSQTVFAHPIHYGIAGSMFFGLMFYVYKSEKWRYFWGAICAATPYFAQSSAPLLAVGIQVGIIVWGKFTRDTWKPLAAIVMFVYVFLSLASNRGPIIIIVETLTLNPATAWWRIHIWHFGMQNVWANPIMGLGLNEWERPHWLASTVDNFWLLMAMRHGIPAALALLGAVAYVVIRVLRVRGLPEHLARARTGYIVSFCGFFVALSTVHAWGQLLVFSMFFIGMGSLFFEGGAKTDEGSEAEAEDADQLKPTRYSRFPVRARGDAMPPNATPAE